MSLLSVLALGVFLGMRHATDADHVVAVTTLVARRQNTRAAMLLGALWGAGHGLTILIVGGAIILLGIVVPPRLGLSLELGVGVMLITLGAMNLSGASRKLAGVAHSEPHADVHSTSELPARRFRSFIIGVVHGLAGSAAVALLVLSTIRDAGLALLYLGLFGLGTVAGMMLLTTAISFPLAAAARRFGPLDRLLGSVTGAVSMAFGIFLVYQIGFVDGLFGADPSWSPK
jgi:cytochrome c biogenesis protein CcdA